MTSIDVDVDGVAQLTRTLTAAGKELADLEAPSLEVGRQILRGAEIPTRTGYLANHAEVAASQDGFTLTDSAPYAVYVHAANPFFTRALTAGEQRVLDALTTHAEHVLHDVTGT